MGTGYKEMLRNRLPTTVDYALKWCKAKQKWIDHTYNAFIKIYLSKSERKESTRITLGISKKQRYFDFHDTINWDMLSKEETYYWNTIESWVVWYEKLFLYIQNDYKNSLAIGKDLDEFKQQIKSDYLTSLDPETQENLTNYLIRILKGLNY